MTLIKIYRIVDEKITGAAHCSPAELININYVRNIERVAPYLREEACVGPGESVFVIRMDNKEIMRAVGQELETLFEK